MEEMMQGIDEAIYQRMTLSSCFSKEFLPIAQEYVEEIREALATSDTVVLNARRAVCFYYALVRNGEIETCGSSRVISSRALDCLPDFEELDSIAVVDDVVVHGDALTDVAKHIVKLKGRPRIIVAAVNSDLFGTLISKRSTDVRSLPLRAVKYLPKESVLRFANEMVDYVQRSGISNNIDQPLFKNIDAELVYKHPSWWHDVTTKSQRVSGIRSLTCTIDNSRMADYYPLEDISKVRIKARVLVDGGVATVIPFVLLPPISSQRLKSMVSTLLSQGSPDLMNLEGTAGRRFNYRYVHYVLALLVGQGLLSSMGVTATPDKEHERMLFGADTSLDMKAIPCSYNIVPDKASLEIKEYLLRSQGVALRTLLAASLNGDGRGREGWRNTNVSYSAIEASLRSHYRSILGAKQLRELTSCCVDRLVDKGLLVPMLQECDSLDGGTVARSYRGGEVFALTKSDLEKVGHVVRAFVSGEYALGEQYRRRGMLEQLAVIFIRWIHAEQQAVRENGVEWVSQWHLVFDQRTRLLQNAGLTLLDLVEASGHICFDDASEICTSGMENGHDSLIDPACSKFVRDMHALEASFSGQTRATASIGSFEQLVNAVLLDGSPLYQIRALQPYIEKYPLELSAAIEIAANGGDTDSVRRFAETMRRLTDANVLQNDINLLAIEMECASGVSRYDFLKYCQVVEYSVLDMRAYQTIMSRAHACAQFALDCVIAQIDRKAEFDDSMRAQIRRSVGNAEALSHVVAAVADNPDSPGITGLAGAVFSDSETRPRIITRDIWEGHPNANDSDLCQSIVQVASTASGMSTLAVCLPTWEPFGLVIPYLGRRDIDSMQLELENIYPTVLREDISRIGESFPDVSGVVLIYCEDNANAVYNRANAAVGNADIKLSANDKARRKVLKSMSLRYNASLYRCGKKKGKPMSEKKAEKAQTIQVAGDYVAGDKYTNTGEGHQIIFRGRDNSKLTINPDKDDWRTGLDKLQEAVPAYFAGDDAAELDEKIDEIRLYSQVESGKMTKSKSHLLVRVGEKVEAINELRELWTWLYPLLATALGVIGLLK